MGFSAIETFRRWLSAFARRGQPLRVLIALCGAVALCGFGGRLEAAPPVLLGIVASALAETDDSWRGRVRTQLFALVCFAIAASVASLLLDRPVIFAMVLAGAAFCLTMLGAVDVRYKPIGPATLILAMAVVLAASHAAAATGIERGRLPILLLAGAAWYGLLSVLWCAFLPAQPVQRHLVRLFDALGDCMRFKASLSGSARGPDSEREGLSLALLNAAVVTAFNAAKESILRRIGTGAPTERIARYRGLYLIAQDVHERASAFHDDTGAADEGSLRDALMARCREVLDLQGQACMHLARSIEWREPFAADATVARALADLRAAVAHAWDSATPDRMEPLPSIEAIAQNLVQLGERLASAGQPVGRTVRTDLGPLDRAPRSWRDAARRVRRQLATRSALFRHAWQSTLALLVGGGVAWLLGPAQGGWVLLAVLLVCQQSAGEALSRIGGRVAGTLLGVAAGWGLQQVFVQPLPHALLAVAAGTLFFAAHAERTLCRIAALASLLVLCSSPMDPGAASIVPWLAGAAAGGVVAALALLLVLPYWQARRINELAAATLRNHAGYLRQAIEQYRAGARDDLAYRLARRNAHNADAALSTAVADMLRDPRWMWPRALAALHFLLRSHAVLGGLSALGAHRAALPDPQWVARLREAAEDQAAELEHLADGLEAGVIDAAESGLGFSASGEPDAGDGDQAARRAGTELTWIRRQVGALRRHAREWLSWDSGVSPDDAAHDAGETRTG